MAVEYRVTTRRLSWAGGSADAGEVTSKIPPASITDLLERGLIERVESSSKSKRKKGANDDVDDNTQAADGTSPDAELPTPEDD